MHVDDLLLNTIELAKTVNQTRDQKNPFKEPHYILVNLARGGTQGGDPLRTEFPARYEVDPRARLSEAISLVAFVKFGGDRR